MAAVRIILFCIIAAIFYGVVHDQFTARICLEYFTIAHPRLIATDSPTLLALFWGVVATWWVGVILGVPLAIACRAGSRPRLQAGQLFRPIGTLLICMAICALASGIAGFVLQSRGMISMGDWETLIPPANHARFMADAFAHLASYASGFVGGMIVIVWAVCYRRRIGAGG